MKSFNTLTNTTVILLGVLLGGSLADGCHRRKISNLDRVEQGYAIPSKLEIQVKDLLGDGQRQTVLKYGTNSYLFRLDSNGAPVAIPYEISQKRILPKRQF